MLVAERHPDHTHTDDITERLNKHSRPKIGFDELGNLTPCHCRLVWRWTSVLQKYYLWWAAHGKRAAFSSSKAEQGVQFKVVIYLLAVEMLPAPRRVSSAHTVPPQLVSSSAGSCSKTTTVVCSVSRFSGRLWMTSSSRPEKTSKHFELIKQTCLNKLKLFAAVELKVFGI